MIMNTHADKTQKNKSQSVANETSQKQSGGESTFQFVDNRPEVIAQKKLQVTQLMALQDMANNSPQVEKAAQLQAMADNHSSQQQQPIQKKENNTGLPDTLKTGMEHLSGMSLGDVKVHRNSDKPAQLQAHAYAQGTDIHLGPGQEKHLPHEAWHVIQQKQGRVKPTMQMKGKININDDAGLEKEADFMGNKALYTNSTEQIQLKNSNSSDSTIQRQVMSTDEFITQSKSTFSGPRNRVLEVDNALEKYHGGSSKSVGLSNLIDHCKKYLNVPDKKASARVVGVKALLLQATQELAAWRLRDRVPLPDSVYRMDERPPATIGQVGFQAWNSGGDITIIEHVTQVLREARADAPNGDSGEVGKGAKKHSQFVSTAGDLNFAKDQKLLQGLPSKIFYKIDTTVNPQTFKDVNQYFDAQGEPNPYETQFEYIQSGGILGDHVTHYVSGKDLIPFVVAGTDASTWNIPWTPMPALQEET